MNTIKKLQYLNETKNSIKSAIENQGVEVQDSDTFRSYSDKINSIENSGINLLDYKYCLESAGRGWLKSEEQWNSKNDYQKIWEVLLIEYNNEIEVGSIITLSSSYKYEKRGILIKSYEEIQVMEEEYEASQEMYKTNTSKYYFVIDLENETFRLPTWTCVIPVVRGDLDPSLYYYIGK